MEEHELIRQALRGDHAALSQLLQLHYDFVYKYLLKITMHPAMAEDLTQETMIKSIEKISLYKEKSSKFSSWLMTIATRLYIDQGRRRKREKLWQEEQQSLRYMQWQAGNQHEDWPDVLNALSELSEDSRIPLILKHYYGYTYEEIGSILAIAEGTAKSRVHHALKQVRKELG
ncbi:RNA polymerase sigma factor SigY [Paenibacillus marchantiophytorum]|uniref:RNA polymerase sigma factor n=1 Tax=Paenibacillus marchantiophytorum TaxID=1619310 RepID=A0ABQ1F366_9BACL|nr:RNA polymerase sigma factor SigY [Paenibacillus marchantiophytorum]GFZ97377.1 RNA polymerase sigma factor SigY [Paenibacillus marchantiophytorum]